MLNECNPQQATEAGKSKTNRGYYYMHIKLGRGECPYPEGEWKSGLDGPINFPPVEAFHFQDGNKCHTKSYTVTLR